jgi:uncharacterized protein (TIGR02328 family)
MRLWHRDLIPVLPRQQLVAAWRELSACATNIRTKGTPNHILVNKIMDYPLDHFISYAAAVREEMTKRGYKTMDRVWDNITSVKEDYTIIPLEECFPEWHNHRYFIQCYHNLEEKADCGGISFDDWYRIYHIDDYESGNFILEDGGY